MAHEVIWSEGSLGDVEQIIAYLRPKSEQSARRIGEAIFASAEVLRKFPGIGPIFSHDPTGDIHEILSGSYRIFYSIDDDQQRVEILDVRHGSRRDPDLKQLRDRID